MQKHFLIPSGYIILKDGNKILLSRRFQTGYMDGFYSFPAGHVEKGERFLDCGIRELKEEIGVEVKEEDLKLVQIMHRYNGKEMIDFRIDVFYTCSKWNGDIQNMEPNKCDDLQWFEIDNLPINIVPYIKKAIENIQNGIFFSEI